ncbi:hypothetical protein HYPSUDRAFT_51624 [Hypholoma sublateritium FD-334 SS-4]|uniref:DUF6533 domain-containing protein n=1 Tax=Hypholoma sublateritium (strain FD-334 SS-4) TaxID=945553 RepID=A0A0D2MWB1_HYPSF|nr:hypothetical protein HYPSUDRAFT_51624 [Hypholoma sublateritium FD-334 SS-4]
MTWRQSDEARVGMYIRSSPEPAPFLSNSVIRDSPAYTAGIAIAVFFQSVQYGYVSVLCVVFYEWVANLPDEIRLIYPSDWSTVKIAYFLCRYYPLLYVPVAVWAYCGNYSQAFCDKVALPMYALMAPLLAAMYISSTRHLLRHTVPNHFIISRLRILAASPSARQDFNFEFNLQYTASKNAQDGRLWPFISSNKARRYRPGLMAFAWTTFTNIGSVLVYFHGFGLPFILAISNLLVSAMHLATAGGSLTSLFCDRPVACPAQQDNDAWVIQDWQEPVPPAGEVIQMDDASGPTRDDGAAY